MRLRLDGDADHSGDRPRGKTWENTKWSWEKVGNMAESHTDDGRDVTTEQYRNRWDAHIGELEGLGWHLSGDERDRLQDAKDELRDLLDAAAERREAE